MEPEPTIWTATLESYRKRAASSDSASTAVSVAVVAATLGASLLQMVLEVMAKRKSFAGEPHQLAELRCGSREAAERLARFADADIAAYLAYREARRSNSDAAELERCRQRTVEVPLEAARAAIAALDLCGQARNIVSGAITADLSAAAILLESAVRAILRCVEENLRAPPGPRAAAECTALGEEASRMLRLVLTARVEE